MLKYPTSGDNKVKENVKKSKLKTFNNDNDIVRDYPY